MPSSTMGRLGLLVHSLQPSMALSQLSLQVVQGAPFDLKRFHGGFKTVFGPEDEHAGFMFGFLAEHVATYGIVGLLGKASNSESNVVDSQLPPSSTQRVQDVSGLMHFPRCCVL